MPAPNNYAVAKKPITLPADLTSWFSGNIYTDGTTDWGVAQYEPAFVAARYLDPNGNDSADGLTPQTAWKTLTKAISGTGYSHVYAAEGDYWGVDNCPGINNYIAETELAIICTGSGRANFYSGDEDISANFVADGTYADVYVWEAHGTAVISCWDAANPTDYPVYNQDGSLQQETWGWMTAYTDLASLAAHSDPEKGAYMGKDGNLYVKTVDNRAPDSDIKLNQVRRWNAVTGSKKLYSENIGYYYNILGNTAGTGTNEIFAYKNCFIGYGNRQENLHGVEGNGSMFMENCNVRNAGSYDLLSLRASAKAILYNVTSIDASFPGPNNCFTGHGSSEGLVVGGKFRRAGNPTIGFIEDSKIYAFGVGSYDANAGDFNIDSSTTNAWLVNCNTVGSTASVGVQGGGNVYIQGNNFPNGYQNVTQIPYAAYDPAPVAGVTSSVSGSTITFSSETSGDPAGLQLTYAWVLTSKPAGSAATLSSATAANPTVTADLTGDYIAELVVTNSDDLDSPSANTTQAFVANTAPTGTIAGNTTGTVGTEQTFSASTSTDPENDTLSYSWSLIVPSGSSATLTNATGVTTAYTPDIDGSYDLLLTVSDGELSDNDMLTIAISEAPDTAPTANAGTNQTLAANIQGQLSGSGTATTAGATITSYQWVAPAGITLIGANTANPTFTAPQLNAATTFTFSLVVTDSNGLTSVADTVDIIVEAYSPPVVSESELLAEIAKTKFTLSKEKVFYAFSGRGNLDELKFKLNSTNQKIALDNEGCFDFSENDITKVSVISDCGEIDSTTSAVTWEGSSLFIQFGAFSSPPQRSSIRIVVYVGNDDKGIVIAGAGLPANIIVTFQ